jgi:colanic acid biosynthesis protein WcaH
MIELTEYKRILEVIPILCVDVIIENDEGEYLLVFRNNHPMKDHWWVVGGRVEKGELLTAAACRTVRQEVGLDAREMRSVGYYEGHFDENAFDVPTRLHTVSVVFATRITSGRIALDAQSSDWKYARALPAEFLVHPFGTEEAVKKGCE